MKKKALYSILLLSNWYPNRTDLFPGDFVQRHAIAIANEKFQIQVVHIVGDHNRSLEVVENQVNPYLKEKIIYFPKSNWKFLNFLKKSYWVWKILQSEDYQMVHLNIMYFHFWPLLFNSKPLLITEHFSGFLPINIGEMSRFRKEISKRLLQKANAVTAVSKNLASSLQKWVPNKDISIIPNVVNTDLFMPQNTIDVDIPVFLHISNLLNVKNIPIILEAILLLAQRRQDFKFKIGGNGNLQLIKDFRSKNQLEDIIEIIPTLSHQEVAKEMQEASAFVLYSQFENQPCVIIESFSSGLPVISSNVGGIAENFPFGFGMLLPPNDATVLANAMENFLEEKRVITPQEMHDYAKRNFSSEVIGKRFRNMYQKLLNNA